MKNSQQELKRSTSIIPIDSTVNVWNETRQISESKLHKKVSRAISRYCSRINRINSKSSQSTNKIVNLQFDNLIFIIIGWIQDIVIVGRIKIQEMISLKR